MSGATGVLTASAAWVNNDGTWNDAGRFAEAATLTDGKAVSAAVVITASTTTSIDLQAITNTAFGKTLTTSFDYITGYSLKNTGTIDFSIDCSAAANPWIKAWDIDMDWLLEPGDVFLFASDVADGTDGFDVDAGATKIHLVNAAGTNGQLTYVFLGY